MNFKIALMIFFMSSISNAQFKTEQEMKEFFEKKQRCSLAIGINNQTVTGTSKGERTLVNIVLCISDFTSQEGTINEKRGCGFAVYDVLKDKLSTPYTTAKDGRVMEDPKKTKGLDMPMVSKKCIEGGSEDLMKEYAGAPLGGTSVVKTLTEGPLQDKAEKVLLYASSPSLKKFWETEYNKLNRRK